MTILTFHMIITKMLELIEFLMRTTKIMKILKFQLRSIVMNIFEFQTRNQETNENLRIQRENDENYENH